MRPGIGPGHTFAGVQAWVRALAEELAVAAPGRIAVARGATHRGPLVTIDHAQNSPGRNTAAPYTLRARPGVPVSTPLTWDEVVSGRLRPADFTPRAVLDRLRRLGDPFAPVLLGEQRLPTG